MPNLNELGLSDEAAPQVDWDAPEAGQTPPAVYPGVYRMEFRMPEDKSNWFDKRDVDVYGPDGKPTGQKTPILQVNYTPRVLTTLKGDPVVVDGENPILPRQRADFYKSPKMLISKGAELLRGLGVRLEGPIIPQIQSTLEQVNGNATFVGEVIWRAYFKSTETTVSTTPRKGKGGRKSELAWPREQDGRPTLLAVDPQTGEKMYGYPEIARVKAPGEESAAAAS